MLDNYDGRLRKLGSVEVLADFGDKLHVEFTFGVLPLPFPLFRPLHQNVCACRWICHMYVNTPFVRMCRMYIYSRSFSEVSNIMLYYHVTIFRSRWKSGISGGPLGLGKKSDEKIERIKASHILVWGAFRKAWCQCQLQSCLVIEGHWAPTMVSKLHMYLSCAGAFTESRGALNEALAGLYVLLHYLFAYCWLSYASSGECTGCFPALFATVGWW